MAIQVLFFASVRERLGCEHVELEWSSDLGSVAAVEAELIRRGGDTWQEVLQQENIVRALNHEIVALEAVVSDGSEVAFYPPVTGG